MGGTFPRLVDHFLRLCVRLRQNFRIALLRFRELLLDLLAFRSPSAMRWRRSSSTARIVCTLLAQDQRDDDEELMTCERKIQTSKPKVSPVS